jgi:hypothetical protein
MKKKIGTSKSMKKYGPGGMTDAGPGSKSTSKDVDKLPPMSAPPTGTGYMKKGGSVGKKKMALGGTNKVGFKDPSDNVSKPSTSGSLRPAAPNPTTPKYTPAGANPPKKIIGTKPRLKMGGSIKSKKK